MYKELMLGALRQGATGNQILEILEVIVNSQLEVCAE